MIFLTIPLQDHLGTFRGGSGSLRDVELVVSFLNHPMHIREIMLGIHGALLLSC